MVIQGTKAPGNIEETPFPILLLTGQKAVKLLSHLDQNLKRFASNNIQRAGIHLIFNRYGD